MQNLQTDLIELLKHEDNLVVDNQLNKNKIIEAALKVEPFLISLLIKNDTFKKHFFQEVENVLVFDKIKFQRFVNNKSFLPDSYTAFKNKIGLAINDDTTDNFIKTKNDVVLVWPHKDCVLEGGQTKEDQKRNEIFWNETLAPDSVDRLLDAKAFTNFKKYDKDGEHTVTDFKGDENLILKGNNLLVLSSLLKTHRSKIKLIYIDPPYNTGSDSFGYNDSFNHSTWLTFMKNRLVIAKQLLSKDGFIFVNIDDNQEGYLSVLMDEIFGKSNRYDKISVKTSSSQGGFGDVNPGYISNTENIIIYSKDKNSSKFVEENLYVQKDYDENYTQIIINSEEPIDKWSFENLNNVVYRQESIKEPYNNQTWRKLKELWGENWKEKRYSLKSNLALKYKDSVFRTFNPNKPAKYLKEALDISKKNKNKIIKAVGSNEDVKLCLNGEVIAFYSNIFKTIDNDFIPATRLSTFWGDIPWEGIANEGGVKLNNGKKPEKLIRRIIESVTNENDIILDFHLGSGTTAAVAHKLKRKYIGVEQIQTQISLSLSRLKNVMDGDSTGVSKIVNWQGGGSFVYAELMEYNQYFINKIQDAKTKDDILKVWEEMQDKAFISYQFDKDMFNKRLEAFKTASLGTMQHYLIEILDKNQLYVNFSEIEDKAFKVSEEDKALNYSFYNKK